MNNLLLKNLLTHNFPKWNPDLESVECDDPRFSNKLIPFEKQCFNYLDYLTQLEIKIREVYRVLKNPSGYNDFFCRLYHHRQKFIYRSITIMYLQNCNFDNILI